MTPKELKKKAQSKGMNVIYLRSKSASRTWLGNEHGQGEHILVRNGKVIAMSVENIENALNRLD